MASLTLSDIQTEIFEYCWPIGSVFITSKPDNPSTLLKGATNSAWKKIEGRFLIGADSTYIIQSIGGEATHTLSQNEIPSHTHTRGSMNITGFFGSIVPDNHSNTAEGAFIGASRPAGYNGATYRSGTQASTTPIYGYDLNASRNWSGETSSIGGNAPHNNIPPYYAVNIWERVS